MQKSYLWVEGAFDIYSPVTAAKTTRRLHKAQTHSDKNSSLPLKETREKSGGYAAAGCSHGQAQLRTLHR